MSGRRNMLGSCIGRRRCEWFACTSKILAHLIRSNTNVQCPYRLPLTSVTHDKDCKNKKCLTSTNTRKLTVVTQRAMKTMAGYFGGYISKKQKVGNFEIRQAVKALPLFFEQTRRKNNKSGNVQLARITNRMFCTLETKGILRTAPEETMLSALHKAHDPLAAVDGFRMLVKGFLTG